MKIFVLAATIIATLSAISAAEHPEKCGSCACTITNESPCNGQTWSGSTCCPGSCYECRGSDDGQNVQRCQKKCGEHRHKELQKGSCTITNEPQCNGHNWSGSTGNTGGRGSVADWGTCTGNLNCKNAGSTCVKHSNYYSQCMPKTLPAGELCGQNDGTNVWKYDKCPSNQKCAALGSDFRCTNKQHHKAYNQQHVRKDASCTIPNESQCDGQNWSGSTCCADSTYECRWSDAGLDVKLCQKIAHSDVDDYSYEDDNGYTSYVDDYGDCTSFDVGCSNPTSWCISHSEFYAQCKPDTLPPGELCGQDDGTTVWYYPYCTSGETCEPLGTDYRCTKAKKRHHHHPHRQHRA